MGFWCVKICYEWLALNKVWVLTYSRDINPGNGLDQFRHFVDDLKNFLGQFSCTNFTATRRNHCDLLGLRQWCCHFGGDLIIQKWGITIVFEHSIKYYTLGNVSNSMSTMAASRYSLQASAFLANCSDSAVALALIANASASPRILI